MRSEELGSKCGTRGEVRELMEAAKMKWEEEGRGRTGAGLGKRLERVVIEFMEGLEEEVEVRKRERRGRDGGGGGRAEVEVDASRERVRPMVVVGS